MNNRHKKVITTYNDAVAKYFAEMGLPVRVVYEADGVSVYKIVLRGRKQCALVKDTSYNALAAAATLDGLKVAQARTKLPLYYIAKDTIPALVVGKDGAQAIYLSRSKTILENAVTPEGGTMPDNTAAIEVDSWSALKALLDEAGKDRVKKIRFLVSAKDKTYQETFDLRLISSVVDSIVTGG